MMASPVTEVSTVEPTTFVAYTLPFTVDPQGRLKGGAIKAEIGTEQVAVDKTSEFEPEQEFNSSEKRRSACSIKIVKDVNGDPPSYGKGDQSKSTKSPLIVVVMSFGTSGIRAALIVTTRDFADKPTAFLASTWKV